jgi:hypothetical protein
VAAHLRNVQWVDAPLGLCTQVIEYCKYHVEAGPQEGSEKPGKSEEEVKTWDNEFVKVDQGTLFELILVRLLCSSVRLHRKLVEKDCATLSCSVCTQSCASAIVVRNIDCGRANTKLLCSHSGCRWCTIGCQLPQHQEPLGFDMSHRCKHDQGWACLCCLGTCQLWHSLH